MNIFKRREAGPQQNQEDGGGQEGNLGNEDFNSIQNNEDGGDTLTENKSSDAQAEMLEKYSLWAIFGLLFLLPVLFIPSLNIPFQFTKTALVFTLVFVSVVFFILAQLKSGKLVLPYNRILIALWALPLVYFVTSIFSTAPQVSFTGNSFDTDTFSFMALMAIFVSLLVMLFRKKEYILYSYIVLFFSFIVVWLFQGARLLFGQDFMSFGVLTLPTSNILGKWNDLAIFFGLATIMTLVTVASLRLSKVYKRILYSILAVALFFLAVVNFNIAWFIVGLFALGFFVHSVGIGKFNWKQAGPAELNDENQPTDEVATGGVSIPALVVLVVAILFIAGGDTVGNSLASRFGISQIEARPSWQTTVSIAKDTYADHAIFGSGPNTFVKQWTRFKPQEINNTIFWNADFISGIGTVPTSFVTTGILGVIAWFIFLGLFVYGGLRALILAPVDNRFSYFLSLSSFLAGLYLWILAVFYTPNVVILTLTFFFTAVFIASLRHYSERFQEYTFSLTNNPKMGSVFVLSIVAVIVVSIASVYSVGQTYVATKYFQKGVIALNVAGDIDSAEASIAKAISLKENDRYYRVLADIGVVRIGDLQRRTDLSEGELRNNFQTFLSTAILNGQKATELDDTNYQNWMALGRVYQSVVTLGIEGAYDNAVTAYNRARELHPNAASIPLTLARLEVANGDNSAAREYIKEAIALKSNYTEAIFLLSQIDIADGNIKDAITSVESASFIAPNNPVIFFQLGLLKYNQGDDEGAIKALQSAVRLNKLYSNARYFLGLAYDRTGNKDEAIAQFKEIEKLNQDNQEVKLILENLRAGRAPFASAGDTVKAPLEREELPIEEGGEVPLDGEIEGGDTNIAE